jgi:hypothetical protein
VRHGDPQRGVVVSGPGAPRERHRREVVVVERTRLDSRAIAQFDAPVGQKDLCRHIASQNLPRGRRCPRKVAGTFGASHQRCQPPLTGRSARGSGRA